VVTYEILFNIGLLVTCYFYIILVIYFSGRIKSSISRKFLHIMIGNFVFIIPFFTFNEFPLNFPFLVAAPFVAITFLASPYSPIKSLTLKMHGLTAITEGGHHLGLFLYAVSYTILAGLFASQPYLIAVGILPMAYGDAAAALIGKKFGNHQYCVFAKKSFEGSAAMFIVTVICLLASGFFFIVFSQIPAVNIFKISIAAAVISVIAEAITPKGFDNITIPLLSVFIALFLFGGII